MNEIDRPELNRENSANPTRIPIYIGSVARNVVPLLKPLVGESPPEENGDPLAGRFDRYFNTAGELFRLSGITECCCAVYPYDFGEVLSKKRDETEAIEFFKLAKTYGKPTIIFCWHDYSGEFPSWLESTNVFRTGVDRACRRSREHVLPTFNEDFVTKYCAGILPIRSKGDLPVISFCGRSASPIEPWDPLALWRWVRKRILKRQRQDSYLTLRMRAMEVLRKEANVLTKFVVSSKFWGGLGDSAATAPIEDRRTARARYLNNMLDSDYVLCVRGAGNFSMRVYEALCLGRIPVLIETGGALPFEDEVDWSEFSLRVNEENLPNLGKALASFHKSISDSKFREMQLAARQFWEGFIEPASYFRWLHRAMENELVQ